MYSQVRPSINLTLSPPRGFSGGAANEPLKTPSSISALAPLVLVHARGIEGTPPRTVTSTDMSPHLGHTPETMREAIPRILERGTKDWESFTTYTGTVSLL